MRLTTSISVCLLAAVSNAIPTQQGKLPVRSLPTEASSDEKVASSQLAELAQFAAQSTNGTLSKNGTCSPENISVRREWSTLPKEERKAYTDAVLCLQSLPAKTPSSVAAGAKSRYDDFVVTHMQQTQTIHYTGTFLAWHRYFTWIYEKVLQDECGYAGVQPYWDWSLTAQIGLENSTMLDGSEYSMSGNGAFVNQTGDIVVGGTDNQPAVVVPTGTGGGCVISGPFSNMSVNLGPANLSIPGGGTEGGGNGYAYNPRCLRRDLTDSINQQYANATLVVDNIVRPQDVYDFQMTMQSYPGGGSLGIHGGGHYTMGGDPGRDVQTSPGDPLFYLHHGMIDRVWWIWQQLDVTTRTSAEGISGTGTYLNSPESANTTMDTVIELGYAFEGNITMSELMSTTAGPFCYIYM